MEIKLGSLKRDAEEAEGQRYHRCVPGVYHCGYRI
ncbi:MAG: hypothetical protein CM1200mP27_02120 [Chloroflexota bacterium]|nr:MAG: hypothetical protein CM1200mP27_02120 [Chloroflexota bacterium]